VAKDGCPMSAPDVNTNSTTSGTFLRLENDGDKALVAFCGAPIHQPNVSFNEKTKTYEAWTATARAAGRRRTTRYAINVFTFAVNGADVNAMQVVEMADQTMRRIFALKGMLDQHLFAIFRRGAKADRNTSYDIQPDKIISPQWRAVIGRPTSTDPDGWIEGAAPLFDLERVTEARLHNPVIPAFWLRNGRGWPEHKDGMHANYQPVARVLSRSYKSDVHYAQYYVPGIERRLTVDAVELIPDGASMVIISFDIDDDEAKRNKLPPEQRAEWIGRERRKTL